ncbi:MAG TPA: hypothetical protein VF821_01635 [Lentzea sp.]
MRSADIRLGEKYWLKPSWRVGTSGPAILREERDGGFDFEYLDDDGAPTGRHCYRAEPRDVRPFEEYEAKRQKSEADRELRGQNAARLTALCEQLGIRARSSFAAHDRQTHLAVVTVWERCMLTITAPDLEALAERLSQPEPSPMHEEYQRARERHEAWLEAERGC